MEGFWAGEEIDVLFAKGRTVYKKSQTDFRDGKGLHLKCELLLIGSFCPQLWAENGL